MARTCGVLYIFTSKCASRHNGVQFFDISTAKCGPNVVCFVHFDLEMCFAPQRRAIFHLIWPAGSAPAALASLSTPRTPKSFEKHSVLRLSYLFSHLHLLSSYSFSSTLLSSNLALLSASSLLCFSSVHIVGSLTSKLPPIMFHGRAPSLLEGQSNMVACSRPCIVALLLRLALSRYWQRTG